MLSVVNDGRDQREATYTQWVRRVLKQARANDSAVRTLFDSSVPEPRALLAEVVARGFAQPITDRYVSAFAGGNPFILGHLTERYRVSADQVICTTGATGALSLLLPALVTPGERILVEMPGFDLFGEIAGFNGIAVDRFARTGSNFRIDLNAIEAHLRPDTRAILITDLHNPSGHCLPRSVLAELAKLAGRRGVLIIVDEVYAGYADEGTRAAPAFRTAPNCISVNSLTKIYGLSTLRCGWIIGDPNILAPVRARSERTEFGISNLAHAAAALVMDEAPRFDAYSANMIAEARPLIEESFSAWRADGLIEGELPQFGCITFPRLTGIDDTLRFSEWLIDEHKVVVAPGEHFGSAGHVRIGFANERTELKHALTGLDAGLRQYRRDRRVPTAASAAR